MKLATAVEWRTVVEQGWTVGEGQGAQWIGSDAIGRLRSAQVLPVRLARS